MFAKVLYPVFGSIIAGLVAFVFDGDIVATTAVTFVVLGVVEVRISIHASSVSSSVSQAISTTEPNLQGASEPHNQHGRVLESNVDGEKKDAWPFGRREIEIQLRVIRKNQLDTENVTSSKVRWRELFKFLAQRLNGRDLVDYDVTRVLGKWALKNSNETFDSSGDKDVLLTIESLHEIAAQLGVNKLVELMPMPNRYGRDERHWALTEVGKGVLKEML